MKTNELLESIANSHNQAAAPSWLDKRYLIWKENDKSGFVDSSSEDEDSDKVDNAFQGYTLYKSYVIAWGSPLCEKSRWPVVARKFIHWCNNNGYTLIWTCVERDFESTLSDADLNWSSLSCIRQDIVDLTTVNLVRSRDVRNNVRRSIKANIKIDECLELNEDDRLQVDQGIVDWKKKRSGLQIATQDLQPWVDLKHRRVFFARSLESNKIVGFTVLAKLSKNCFQIEHSIVFPSAPRGVSEHLLHDVLETIQSQGYPYCSFGVSASDKLIPTNNLSSVRMAWLSKMYNTIIAATGLTNRGAFREKFDVTHQPLFICYPKGKFGSEALNALMKSVHTK